MSHSHFLGSTGWVGRVPPGIKEFLNLPFLVLKARHPAPNTLCIRKARICIKLKLTCTLGYAQLLLLCIMLKKHLPCGALISESDAWSVDEAHLTIFFLSQTHTHTHAHARTCTHMHTHTTHIYRMECTPINVM